MQGGLLYKLNNGACTNIPYTTVEVKHIWLVYVTNELKLNLFWSFTIYTIVWMLIAVKNRYLKSKWTKTSQNEVM